jgi:hypothetical protein
MPFPLTGRNILVVSPQKWGAMRVSKHHYAVELAGRSNRVFFLNPPDPGLKVWFSLEGHPDIANLFLVSHKPLVPPFLRFHARWLFDLLGSIQTRVLSGRIHPRLDVLWCFDSHSYGSLKAFNAEKVIYHVVDQVIEPHSLKPAGDADVIVSVAPEILRNFEGLSQRRILINHGLATEFSVLAKARLASRSFRREVPGAPRMGYVGNLLARSLDRRTLKAVISANEGVEFHFWGAHRVEDCNLSADAAGDGGEFVRFLETRPNVRLRGIEPPGRLAKAMQAMDAFLVCYDIGSDVNGGCNTHKLLEYLSTGKVVVSNHISTYQNRRDVIQMSERSDNLDYPRLVQVTLRELVKLNSAALQERRLRLALENTYASHIDRVEAAL